MVQYAMCQFYEFRFSWSNYFQQISFNKVEVLNMFEPMD